MPTTDIVKTQVASATLASLIRIAGGGYSLPTTRRASSASEPHFDVPTGSKDSQQWLDELKRIAYSSISFPNGGVANAKPSSGDGGKPHDVEVRVALPLFHRIRREQSRGYDTKKKNDKRKRKQQRRLQENHLGETGEPCTSSPNNENDSFEVISDLGTRREIDTIQTLANLLSLELESELNNQQQQSDQSNDLIYETDIDRRRSIIQPTNTTSFTDIRPDHSGIICLVSTHRSNQLRSAGRIPCSHCVKWVKGTKGLWWHQLSAHGIDYSLATETASGEVNPLAIVPFQEWEQPEQVVVNIETNQDDSNGGAQCDVFELVKLGKYDEFINLVKDGFQPEENRDRNGASVLHWAAGCGRLDFVSYLIEKCNCCPNQLQRGKRSFMGRTPLHWAARNGHLNVVEYLVTSCKVNIDACTSDGTTAFCWASWQGHLDIMKFLHRSGCDIHATNSFGCNAVLWSAQGAGTCESMSWLLESGADFSLINSNGHGALHKAAQRGCSATIKWLLNTFLQDQDRDAALMIQPDVEGHCPSDLCGMEGHESLAQWIAKQECGYFIAQIFGHAQQLDTNTSSLPEWIQKDLDEAKSGHLTSQISDMSKQWGAGWGVRRMTLSLLRRISGPGLTVDKREPAIDLDGID